MMIDFQNLAKGFIANVVPAIDSYISIIDGGTYDDLTSWDTEDYCIYC